MNTDETWSVTTRGGEETEALAASLAAGAFPGLVLHLRGDLGGGKTTFVRGFARGLGHPDAREVASPTFALHHRYPGGRLVLEHLDLYRLGEGAVREWESESLLEREARAVGVTLVEWPQGLAEREPPHLDVAFTFLDEEERRITLRAGRPEGRELLRLARDDAQRPPHPRSG